MWCPNRQNLYEQQQTRTSLCLIDYCMDYYSLIIIPLLKDSILCARTYIPDCSVDLVAGIILPSVLPDFFYTSVQGLNCIKLYHTTVCHCFQRYCGKPIFGKSQSVDFISLVIHFSDTYFDACHLQCMD